MDGWASPRTMAVWHFLSRLSVCSSFWFTFSVSFFLFISYLCCYLLLLILVQLDFNKNAFMELQAHQGLMDLKGLASVTDTLQDPTVIRVCVSALGIATNLTYLSTSPLLVWKVSVPLSGQQFRPLTYLTPTSTGLITGCEVYSSICKSSACYSQLLLLSPLLSLSFSLPLYFSLIGAWG